jgi:hypothetical protein
MYGLAILSPTFFAQNWPQWELEGLAAVGDAENRKVILPVWHEISQAGHSQHDVCSSEGPDLGERGAG